MLRYLYLTAFNIPALADLKGGSAPLPGVGTHSFVRKCCHNTVKITHFESGTLIENKP